MKKILITAGGTATAWHIAKIAEEFFKSEIEIFVCDINPPELIPASTIAKKSFLVPLTHSIGYQDAIERIIKKEGINCIIPLLPEEAYLFALDSDFVKRHGITSVAPKIKTIDLLANKENLYHTLRSLSIPTPKVFSVKEINENQKYILKPKLGFGSREIRIVSGHDIINSFQAEFFRKILIQEYCYDNNYDEVTLEVFNGEKELFTFARKRIATKAGVCVKMQPVDSNQFYPQIKKIVDNIECPSAFNVQFLKHNGEWKLFDCNLRLAAGTALSTAIGFQLTRAFLTQLLEKDVDKRLFCVNKQVKAVLRVYDEIVIK